MGVDAVLKMVQLYLGSAVAIVTSVVTIIMLIKKVTDWNETRASKEIDAYNEYLKYDDEILSKEDKAFIKKS